MRLSAQGLDLGSSVAAKLSIVSVASGERLNMTSSTYLRSSLSIFS